MKTIVAKRTNFQIEIGTSMGPRIIHFTDHKATVSDDIAEMLLASNPYDFYTVVTSHNPKPGEKVLVIRDVSLGDVMLTTPVIRELANQGVIVDFATDPKYVQLFIGNPNVNKVFALNENKNTSTEGYDHVINLRGTAEVMDHHGYRGHRVKAFGDSFDLHISDYSLDYFVQDIEVSDALNILGNAFESNAKDLDNLIAFGWSASRPERTWTDDFKYKLIDTLCKEGCKIAIFHNEFIDESRLNENAKSFAGRLSLRQSAAAMSLCDLAIMPDTGLLHISSALDLPTVAYMGPFPAEARCTHKHLEVVNNKTICPRWPCFQYHCFNKAETGTPKCINLPVQQVIDAVHSLMEKVYANGENNNTN